jgi:hypothetical protein
LDLTIKQAAADLRLDFNLKEAFTIAQFSAQLNHLTFDAPKKRASELVDAMIDAIRDTRTIGLKVTLKGREPDYKTALTSDIDGVLQKAAGRLVKRQAAQLETQLRTIVNEKLSTPMKNAQNRMTRLDAIGSQLLKRSEFGDKLAKQLKLPL